MYTVMRRHWGDEAWESLRELIRRESGWNHQARNLTSGACGWFQANPCSKLLAVSSIEDRLGQAEWGVDYIKMRYGSPQRALAFWEDEAPSYDFNHDGTPDGLHWY